MPPERRRPQWGQVEDKAHELCMACLDGERTKAEEVNSKLEGLNRELFVESNPIPVKWCLTEIGLFPEGVRLPMTKLSAIYHEKLRQALHQAEVI